MKKPLQILILLTVLLSLAGAIFPTLQYFFTLSWGGIKSWHLWQLITYVFFENGPLSFSFLIQLAFNMYILWIFGSSLMEVAQPKRFFSLYFGSALVGSLPIFLFSGHLAGSTSAVYAILIAWMMINQGSQLLLFFTLPFKSHWLIVALLSFTLFMDFSAGALTAGFSLLMSVLFSYFFSLIIWKQKSPFPPLHSFEGKLLNFLETKTPNYYSKSKIFDFKSGAPVLDDEQFMDAMLEQISRHGEASLTPQEKKRMQAISKRKK